MGKYVNINLSINMPNGTNLSNEKRRYSRTNKNYVEITQMYYEENVGLMNWNCRIASRKS